MSRTRTALVAAGIAASALSVTSLAHADTTTPPDAPAVAPASPVTTIPQPRTGPRQQIIGFVNVAAGQTWWGIARANRVPMPVLVAANDGDIRKPLAVGRQVVIPLWPLYVPQYTLRRATSVRTLAARFGVTPGSIARLNHVWSGATLPAGTVVRLLEDGPTYP